MSETTYHLKSTDKRIYPLPNLAVSKLPEGYQRVAIPYSEIEQRNARNGYKCHLQVMHQSAFYAKG